MKNSISFHRSLVLSHTGPICTNYWQYVVTITTLLAVLVQQGSNDKKRVFLRLADVLHSLEKH